MEESVKKRRGGKITLIVLAVLLVLVAGVLTFAGNYLFSIPSPDFFDKLPKSYRSTSHFTMDVPSALWYIRETP